MAIAVNIVPPADQISCLVNVGFDFNQGITQIIDNVSLIRGKHAFKTGVDAQWIADKRVRGELFLYNFESVFSGTHVGYPRMISGKLALRFK